MTNQRISALFSMGTFVLLVALSAGCAADGETCDLNETQACTCAGGAVGSQTCLGDNWGVCQCGDGGGDGGGGGGGGGGSGGGGGGGGGGGAKAHGDICTAPAFDCGAGTNLVCVLDQLGDAQGVCRASCGSFSDCLNNPQTTPFFDSDCCDIGNGGSVCGQSDDWPAGACD